MSIHMYTIYSVGELLNAYKNGSQSSKQIHTKRETPMIKTVETMVYVDTGVVQFHGQNNVVNYVLSIMNVVSHHVQILYNIVGMQ